MANLLKPKARKDRFMLRYYSPGYDLEFLLQASKPFVYGMEFRDQTLVEIKRVLDSG